MPTTGPTRLTFHRPCHYYCLFYSRLRVADVDTANIVVTVLDSLVVREADVVQDKNNAEQYTENHPCLWLCLYNSSI